MPGLNSILGLLSTVQAVERNLSSGVYTKKALEQNKQKIVELNVEQLYDYGMNSLGVRIDTYDPYSPYTVQIKKEKGQPYDRVTLRDTGDFHRSFEVVFNPSFFYITATDDKTQNLVDRYGENIFGLTAYNKKKITEEFVVPETIKSIRQEIFG